MQTTWCCSLFRCTIFVSSALNRLSTPPVKADRIKCHSGCKVPSGLNAAKDEKSLASDLWLISNQASAKPHTASPPETLTVTVAAQPLCPADGSSRPTWVGHRIWVELLPWITGPNVAHIRKSHGAARSEIDSYSAQDDLITRQFFSYEGSTNNIPQTPPQPQMPPLCLLKTPHYTHTHTHYLSTHLCKWVRFDVTTVTLIEFLHVLIWNSWQIWFCLVYLVFRQNDR